MIARLRARREWQFFATMRRTLPGASAAWWAILLLRAALPALVAVATGTLIGAVHDGRALAGPLTFVGITFVAMQVLPPMHTVVGANLGSRFANWLNEQLMETTLSPPGIGHLERGDLTNDLTAARDFDLGLTGPPMSMNMDFIAGGLTTLLGGVGAALVLLGFAWWAAPLLLIAWGSTHWLLRESGIWRDRLTDEVRTAQRHTEYAYRLAVDPPAAKEVRLFGLAPWVIERFTTNRRRLHDLQYEATRLREKPMALSLLIVLVANVLVFWALAERAYEGRLALGAVVVFAQAAVGASSIAFGGLSWALDGAAAPVAATLRLRPAMADAGALTPGHLPATTLPAGEIRFRDVSFTYPNGLTPVLEHFDLTIPAGTSLAIVGQNGAGKTTLAKLLCRLYDPQDGTIEIDGTDLRQLDIDGWRRRVTAVFQDFVRYELPLRDNVAVPGADDADIQRALAAAGAADLAALDTPLARGYKGGTDLSGGQWQRVALARALAAVHAGAGVVLLDEPTAMLDVRGEAEIFERVLRATRGRTTILVSHRFSTVRLAERIVVVEHGRVIEDGSHDELIALGGRYRTMYDLQASRFGEIDEHGEEVVHESL